MNRNLKSTLELASRIGIWILSCVLLTWLAFQNTTEISNSESNIESKYISYTDVPYSFQIYKPSNEYQKENDIPYFVLTEDDERYIRYMVAGEAANEPFDGKLAVAQCILNAMEKDGLTPQEVKSKYKYNGWRTDLAETNPEAWNDVCTAVHLAFWHHAQVTEDYILYFYAPKVVKSKWHETQEFSCEIGGHRFFCEKG